MLDEIERAHRSVRGTGPGARTAAQQINQAYAVLLSGQFQAFCREIHSESALWVAAPSPNPDHRLLVYESLLNNRRLDRGNPNAGNIGEDFNRFQFEFWTLVGAHHPSNPSRNRALEELNEWRNAIAHQNFKPAMLSVGKPILTLKQVRSWRVACNGLAVSFDDVMHSQVTSLTGSQPW